LVDIQRSEQPNGQVLIKVSLSECLTQLEHQVFLTALESEIRHYQNLRLLFELDDHLTWEPRSMWRHLRFDSQHRPHISKLAIVGGGPVWQKWLWTACQPLRIQEAVLFSSSQKPSAFLWTES